MGVRVFRMVEGKFEWDEAKRVANLAKHGVDFADAVGAFEDGRRLEELDDRRDYGEARWQCVGMAHGQLLFVVYATRGDVRRLISARKANRYERGTYYAGSDRPEW